MCIPALFYVIKIPFNNIMNFKPFKFHYFLHIINYYSDKIFSFYWKRLRLSFN